MRKLLSFQRNLWFDPSQLPDFWYAYVLAGFQEGIADDDDPHSGTFVCGATDGCNRSAIYVETIRECEYDPLQPRIQEQYAVIHEIGHQGGGKHEHLEMMSDGAYPAEGNERFTPVTIATFRASLAF